MVYVAQGYTGRVSMWGNRRAYANTLPEQVDALLARGDVPPGRQLRRRVGVEGISWLVIRAVRGGLRHVLETEGGLQAWLVAGLPTTR